jgi:hypothetical protein
MNNNISKIGTVIAAMLLLNTGAQAGNKDRAGSASATELMVNPWAGSNGVFGLNGATVKGVEALKLNSAGLARSNKFDLGASYNQYFGTQGLSIVNAGASGKLNSRASLGVNVMSVNWGEIPVTTTDLPEGTGVMFKPQMFNMTLGGAYAFTKHIDVGGGLTYVNQSVSNATGTALSLDAGVMYTSGENDELHFGVALRNVGSNMGFTGDGLTYSAVSPDDPGKSITVSQRAAKFQLPTQLNISTAYDIYLGKRSMIDVAGEEDTTQRTSIKGKSDTRLSLLGSFVSNSFSSDYIGIGAELALKDRLMFRAGYRYETGILNEVPTTMYRGLSAGLGLAMPFGNEDNRNKLIFDYAFRPSILGGVHSVGLRLTR